MLRFPVSAQNQADLAERMRALQLAERDMEETYLASAVSLLHRPSGVRVRCGRERSQLINRFLARRLLVEELEARLCGKTRHLVKAERLRDEKAQRERARKRSTTHVSIDPLGGAHLFDPNGAMSAYFLRPLAP